MSEPYVPILPFKRTCERHNIMYQAVRDSEGEARIALAASASGMETIINCLMVVLEQKPEIEALLLLELERKERARLWRSYRKEL